MLINKLLYPIIFEAVPVDRAEVISNLIQKKGVGFVEGKEKYIKAIDEFMKNSDMISKTIDPANEYHDLESLKEYLSKVRMYLNGGAGRIRTAEGF